MVDGGGDSWGTLSRERRGVVFGLTGLGWALYSRRLFFS